MAACLYKKGPKTAMHPMDISCVPMMSNAHAVNRTPTLVERHAC